MRIVQRRIDAAARQRHSFSMKSIAKIFALAAAEPKLKELSGEK